MMEREFIEQKIKELQVEQYIRNKLGKVGFSSSQIKKTPLGDKIIIIASRPGVIVGSKGSTIKQLTKELGSKFKLDNPQIEIADIPQLDNDVNLVAEKIAVSLERFGTSKFKGVAHATLKNVLNAGALGIEILISGKIPGARARRWRFYKGYLKKCGDIAVNGVQKAYSTALLKQGLVGIQVRIMPSNIKLPDDITINDEPVLEESVEEIKEEKIKPKKKTVKKTAVKKKRKKKSKDETDKKEPDANEKGTDMKRVGTAVDKNSSKDSTTAAAKEENSTEKSSERSPAAEDKAEDAAAAENKKKDDDMGKREDTDTVNDTEILNSAQNPDDNKGSDEDPADAELAADENDGENKE